ncbi:phospho-sugar mutase [Paludifilum halophilum]|uniref:Phosphoglucomutase n=1 Tax=Paludifilum halophilum TaxID=1642702 RepID=A0A235B2Z3_9BACL|nr:phospho-sugar mutase [Paludifilum halophilum]OYD06660.1 phosphoglucomutase [Paludifilum halophilum]
MNSAYRRWLECKELDPKLKSELASLSETEIEDAFYRYLDFGTAGMRGILGAGTNRMNLYTVRRVTEGLARELGRQGEKTKKRGVVIAYDSRRQSPDFAEEAAGVLAFHGIHVYLFPSLRPTPVLSFAIRHLGAAAGIMVTASHNPPEYNGYKVYGDDGAQLPPSQVQNILREIEGIEDELNLNAWTVEQGVKAGNIHRLGEEVDTAYMDYLLSLSWQKRSPRNEKLRVVFTPLHGTGNQPVRRVLRELGFTRVYGVREQEQPDPDFPTVPSPNPESQEVFDLAVEQGKTMGADILIGTDPDADRLGLLAKNADGEYIAFNGNQIGVLLLSYLLEQRKAHQRLPEDGVIIKTVVTSDLGRSVAASFGVQTEETLTGFKYIAEKIKAYKTSGKKSFLFGYEESYGCLIGTSVRDKDAVQAAMMCCEMAAWYKEQGLTLLDVLEKIYQKHGYYSEDLFSFTFQGKTGQTKMNWLMLELREHPPESIGGIRVVKLKDYAHGLDDLPPANLLKFHLEDGSWMAVRPSGTEPKIKFYFSAVAENRREAEGKLERMKRLIREVLMR